MTTDLKSFSVLAELAGEELEMLEDLLEPRSLRKGQQLFREGEEADGLWLLAEGQLRLSSSRVGDLGKLKAGACIGALSLVVVGPREITAVAAKGCDLQQLSRPAFRRLLEDSPRAASRVLEAALAEIAGATRRSLDALTPPPAGDEDDPEVH